MVTCDTNSFPTNQSKKENLLGHPGSMLQGRSGFKPKWTQGLSSASGMNLGFLYGRPRGLLPPAWRQQQEKFDEELWPRKSQEDADGGSLGHVLIPEPITVPGVGHRGRSWDLGPSFGLLW